MGIKGREGGASTPVTSWDLGCPLSSNSVGLGMRSTRPNPGTALRVVTFRQRQSSPRGDPGQVPAEGVQAAGWEGDGWDGWMGGWVEEVWDHLVSPSPWLPLGCFRGLLSPAAAGRQGTRELPSQALGLRQREDPATSRGRARAPASAVIGRHSGSFLSAPLCFALWF